MRFLILRSRHLPALFLGSLMLGSIFSTASATTIPEIKFTEFKLDNGLRLIVHEDHKAPIVSINIWYHIGSKNERPGKTGFAHLFEHLMFQGSENFEGEYLNALDEIGATDLNATTWFDRTNYFQTVPKDALDRVLFLESDRMGHLLGAIDQDKLDEQRGVVQNEKRQGDNQPYSKVWEPLLKQVFPNGHPYSWETIGSMDDLDAASLEDVQEWFKTYYGPDNAVLVVAGDIDAETALARVQHYFGDIPPGPPLNKQQVWIPAHFTERREVMQDRVPQARLYKAWTGPQWGSADANQLQLALRILGGGKNSRLYKRLVYDEQIATDVDMDGLFLEIAGLVLLEASAKPGVELATIEAAIEEEIQLFLKKGPTREELQREQTSIRANFIRGIERIGGMGGKSSVLAEYATYGGSPNLYLQDLEIIASATRKDLQNAAKIWLTPFPYVAEIVPFPALQAAPEGIDRSVMPDSGTVNSVSFPEFERRKLDNGLEIILARRDAVPVVNMNLSFDAGYAADNPDSPGVASMAMSMLDEGTSRRTALEISQEIAMLGASLGSGANLDNSTVSLSALSETLDEALDVFADVVLNPTFPPQELERLRTNYVVGIQQEKNSPTTMAIRVLPALLYGEGHSYSQPLTGSGTEESIAAIQRSDLIAYHDAWFKPDNAVLIVVGDTTLEEIVPKIEALFGDWKAGATPSKNIAAVEATTPNAIYLVDRPDAEQSVIFAGQLIRPKANPEEVALKAMNDMLGGMTSARINMNLREDKHWSYGARSLILDTQAQRPLLVYAPVQSDKTSEAILEIRNELESIRDDVPPTAAELDRVKRTDTLSLAGRWETGAAVLGSISEIVRFGLPDNYWDTYAEQVNALTLDDVKSIAVDVLRPDDLIWVVVGDRKQIEAGLRDLDMGEIKLIDADGHALPNNGSDAP